MARPSVCLRKGEWVPRKPEKGRSGDSSERLQEPMHHVSPRSSEALDHRQDPELVPAGALKVHEGHGAVRPRFRGSGSRSVMRG